MRTPFPALVVVLSSLLHIGVFAQFQIFENGTITNATNVVLSTACVNALQSTIQCNSSLVSIAAADYFYQLDSSDFASICTPSCNSSLAAYHKSVASACAGQPEAWPGYPATYFGDVYWASYNLTCLTDSKTGNSCMSYLSNISTSYSEDTAATSLPTSVLCSSCVLSLYRQLQATAYSYYDGIMAVEWANVQKQCGVSYPTAVPVNPTNVTSIPGFAPFNFTTSNVCYSGNTYTVASGDSCIGISKAHNVSTGALININTLLPDCSNLNAGATLCLPQSCITYTVASGDTCASITDASSISFTQFSAWNPSINNYCTNLIAGQEVCIGIPGTRYNGTTIAGATGTQTAIYATATVSPPNNMAFGTTTQCGKYYTVVTGDDCSLVALNNTISITLFEAINPSINAGCTNLVPGLAYCVSPTADWNSTSSASTTSNYITAPDPTPTGTTDYCYEWHVVVTNDNCALLEAEYGITFAQLQQWNPSLNSACGNLILGDAYCVSGDAALSRSSSTAPRTTSSIKTTSATTKSSVSSTKTTSATTKASTSSTKTMSTTTKSSTSSIKPTSTTNKSSTSSIKTTSTTKSSVSSTKTTSATTKASTSSTKTMSTTTKSSTSSIKPTSTTNKSSTSSIKTTSTTKSSVSSTKTTSTTNKSSVSSTKTTSTTNKSSTSTKTTSTTTKLSTSSTKTTSATTKSSTSSTKITSTIAKSSTSSTKTTTVSIPGPTQSGITSHCTAYYLTKTGDSCASIESTFGITFAQFYAWNPAIGSNCGSLWISEAYCVAGPAIASSTVVTAPAPTQTGIAANCNAYTVAGTGASCAAIESQYGITFAQFYAWNPAIGSDCTALWVGEAYCVGVS